jgi:chromosome segregation ATPase
MERARLLRGTLLWSLDARYKRSLTSLKRELKLTHAELAQARERVELVKAAAPQAQLDTAGYAARAAELAQRIRTIQPGLDAAAAAQEKVLARLAIAELELQKRRLGSYASQAQYALAAIYDHAAAGGGR